MILYDLHRAVLILLIQLYCTVCSNPVRNQKRNDVAGGTVREIGFGDLFEFRLAYSADREKFFRLLIEDFECILSESVIYSLRKDFPDPLDLSG